MKQLIFSVLLFLSILLTAQNNRLKKSAIKYLDNQANELFAISDSLWNYSEPSFGEFKSVKLLQDKLRQSGFTIKNNISGSPTMFIATYGTEGPIIGVLGEYDADYNRSTSNTVFQLPASEDLHSAGHNLLGVGALGGVLAIKELIAAKKIKGTIRYYGTTAEGGLGGRTYLARDGYFDDLDLSIFWHPSPVTSANLSSWDAIIDVEISFPTEVKNSLEQAVEIAHFLNGIKKDNDDSKYQLSYLIDSGTTNLAEHANKVQLKVRIEHIDQVEALKLFSTISKQVKNIAPKATVRIFRAVQEFVPNKTANDLVQANFNYLGDINFNSQDEVFAQNFIKKLGKKYIPLQKSAKPYHPEKHKSSYYGYGSDIGDVSWITPEMSFVVTCLPIGASMSNWEGVVFTGHDIGKKGMLYASKIIALSVIDYLRSPTLQKRIHQEFKSRTSHYKYQSIIPLGVPDKSIKSRRTQ